MPLDTRDHARSVAKTGRLLVVDEDYQHFGLTGEIAAIVAELDQAMLKDAGQPARRARCADPLRRPLEHGILPNRDKIATAVKQLAS